MDKKEPQESVSKKGKWIGKWIKSLFLNAYTVGIVVAIFAVVAANWWEQHNQAQDQKRAAMEMLENVVLEMDYNIQTSDIVISFLKNAYQDTLFLSPSPSLALATGAFRAALAAGELRYIPGFAYALIVHYDWVEKINKRLDRIREVMWEPMSPVKKWNTNRYINNTITDLEKLKRWIAESIPVIKSHKSEIVENTIRIERIVTQSKDGRSIINFKIVGRDK